MSDYSEHDVLQFLITNGKIDLASTLHEYELARKQETIQRYHDFKIWQGHNGNYYTYVKDELKGRKLVKKKTLEALEDYLINYYEATEPTVDDVFNFWIEEKMKYGEIQEATRDRYVADFHRYFDGSKLRFKAVRDITEKELEDFIKNQIVSSNLTSKAYAGLRTVIIGTFSYAYKHKISNIAIRTFFNELNLSSKIFNHKVKLAEDNVFTEDEIKMLTDHLLNEKNNPNVISFGIVLAMRSGLRVGELCSLKTEDVLDHCLRICKTETRHRVDGNTYIREVKDNAKTEAGNRYVLIDDEGMRLINEIRKQNPDGVYLFEIDGKRCIGQSFTRKLIRACNTLGIKPRSMHKCRKTYITRLIGENVSEALIIAQVGHTDIKTSKQYYLFNNKAKEEALKEISEAIS